MAERSALVRIAKALDEAMVMINNDKRAAAEVYLRVSKDKDKVEDADEETP